MNSKNFFKVGIVQFDVRLGDVHSNMKTAFEGIKHLGDQGAKLTVLPEMWSCGFDNKNLHVYAEKTPAIIEKLSEIASEYHMIIAGSLPELPESPAEKVFNTLYLVDEDGSVAGFYRKIHLFSPTGEDTYFFAGNKAVVCETSMGPIGLMTCYDLRFPELCRILMDKGALLVVVSAQWPLARIMHWDILTSARAIENQVFMVAANRCGKDPDLEYGGHSRIVSPAGEVLASADKNSCVLHADLDFCKINEFRNKIPCLKQRVPEAYIV
ncbi:MAG: carbon-nitrogen family hydrolase [Deltaproteobacteria bacterium]|nr:carbon-nitrogen family hydrolase [Deltaproteobacteria bacterium]